MRKISYHNIKNLSISHKKFSELIKYLCYQPLQSKKKRADEGSLLALRCIPKDYADLTDKFPILDLEDDGVVIFGIADHVLLIV